MENASKALIIAASVLVAILLVAFGVTIFNKARNSASTDNLDNAEITMFNQQFEKYVNSSILGSQVKSLLSTCISNATTNKEATEKLLTVTFIDSAGSNTNASFGTDIQTYINSLSGIRNSKIVSNQYYRVNCTYDANTSFVNQITISPN